MTRSVDELQELAERDVAGAEPDADADADRVDDADGGADATGDAGPDAGADGSSRFGVPSLRGRLPVGSGRSPVTLRGLLLTFVVAAAGLLVGGAVPLVGGLTRYVGLFAACFALGLVRSRRAYLETAFAGTLAAVSAFLLGTLSVGGVLVGTNLLADYGVPIAGVGVGVGLVLSVAGYYFGRDLRDGLTRDV
ncbi:hypothetical protein [Halobaculum sp. D14]|uniref:hypothetical protein n=1 Tax=unclassified Halobaculum TaxID=2640896 RepID=UPI003EBF8EEE